MFGHNLSHNHMISDVVKSLTQKGQEFAATALEEIP